MSIKQSTPNNNLLPSLPFTLLLALLLTACATEMSTDASQVRDLTGQDVKKCKFIQVLESSEIWGNSGSYTANRSAINKLRNKVFTVGGNAFVVDNFNSSITHNVIQAEALKC
jgi:hypothetical protein